MELWNDYEGKTVDGVYPLERLLSPEGRSAFFATKDASGAPGVLRVIESHFDEEEILGRWARVTALDQENLVGIERSGQAEIDGTKVVYALIEPTDAELAGILRERPLTPDETRQVGVSVVTALKALHGAGLVHEHVEAANVMAKGEVVKLRSDCVRDTPDGREGDEARQRDVAAVATLLNQALTQRRQVGANGGGPLPWPFEDAVRNGTSGTWGLDEMLRALAPPASVVPGVKPNGSSRTVPATAASGAGAGRVAAGTGAGAGSVSGAGAGPTVLPGGIAATAGAGQGVATGATGAGTGAASRPGVPRPGVGRAGSGVAGPVPGSLPAVSAAAVAAGLPDARPGAAPAGRVAGGEGTVGAYARTERVERKMPREAPGRIVMEPKEAGPRKMPLVAGGAAAAVLLAAGLGWHFAHRSPAPAVSPAAPASGAQAPGAGSGAGAGTAGVRSSAGVTGAGAAGGGRRPEKPSAALVDRRGKPVATAAAGAASATTGRAAASGGRTVWRVVAFTYNREDQAQHKAQQIGERHAGLKPAVWTPTGRAPYLVTLGGEMTAEQAQSLRSRARSEGMPSDTFARNFGGR